MTFYKALLASLVYIGVSICIPQPSGSPTNKVENGTIVPSNGILKDKVQLTVYYETHCGASRNFYINELKPAVLKLSSYLDLQLLPYGNAYTTLVVNTTDQYTFDCQHGQVECYGNMIHACAMDVLHNITKVVLLNSCLLDTTYYYTETDLNECGVAEEVTVNSINDILHCANSTRGVALMKSYGDITWKEGAGYVPHLTFSGSSKYERKGRRDLITTVCDMLIPQPQECSDLLEL